MQIILINAYHDAAEHYSTVRIGTDIGEFEATVYCRPEDWNHESNIIGCQLAEIKARMKHAREKRKLYDAQLKALTQFWREMSTTRTYDVDAFWVKKMRVRVDDIDHKRSYWAWRVKDLKESYYELIKATDAANKQRDAYFKRKGLAE